MDCIDAATPDIRVDMAEVSFIACAGINVLIAAQRRAAAAGIGLAVVEPSEPVERLIRLTGTQALLTSGDQAASTPPC